MGGQGGWAGEEEGKGMACTLNDLVLRMSRGGAACKLSWVDSPSFRDSTFFFIWGQPFLVASLSLCQAQP